MRNLVITLACGAALVFTSCGSQSSTNNTGGAAANSNNATANASRPAQNGGLPPVSSAHGGAPAGSGAPGVVPPAGGASGGSAAKPTGIDTSVLDAKIEKAEAKAKASGASQVDKNAAAAAYLERGNVYRDAGQPVLYRYALGDYRRALRYQPDNAEAREKMNEIVSIYQGMGRPVPENGLNEP
ncbi:MAG TPA: tetratricopeptide repeat protein [Pyrinomonadaceae bacterium]|nr:tetratricopeptide repeat protein [Pyrinomonadaceae bacterium]